MLSMLRSTIRDPASRGYFQRSYVGARCSEQRVAIFAGTGRLIILY
jgi:hypothetical protein